MMLTEFPGLCLYNTDSKERVFTIELQIVGGFVVSSAPCVDVYYTSGVKRYVAYITLE